MGFFDKAFEGHVALPSMSELLKAFADLGPAFWMTVIGAALWFLILSISLSAIDRRDLFSGLTYMLFMLATGVILIIALPAKLQRGSELTPTQMVAIFGLLLTSALRWYLRPRAAYKTVVEGKSQSKDAP